MGSARPGRAELAAAGGLLAYLDATQRDATAFLGLPRRVQRSAHMAIDAATRTSLEICRTAEGAVAGSLLGEVDRCVTAAGRRLLGSRPRRAADRPRRHRRPARPRRLVLRRADPPRPRARGACAACPISAARSAGWSPERGGPRDLASLRDGLSGAAELAATLGGQALRPRLLDTLLPQLGGHEALTGALGRALVASPPLDAAKGGFIAEGFDPELDALRSASSDGRRAIAELEGRYREATGVSALKIRHNAVLGYHVEVPAKHADKLLAARQRLHPSPDDGRRGALQQPGAA